MRPVELITDYYEKSGEDVSLEEMKVICNAPFVMMKDIMEGENLEEIRLQYLFVVKVSAPRVIRHLKETYRLRKDKRISDRQFEKYSKLLINHIIENEKKFRKYEGKIQEITGKSLSQLHN